MEVFKTLKLTKELNSFYIFSLDGFGKILKITLTEVKELESFSLNDVFQKILIKNIVKQIGLSFLTSDLKIFILQLINVKEKNLSLNSFKILREIVDWQLIEKNKDKNGVTSFLKLI